MARDLSSQLSVLTQTTDYAALEKCYSIWICSEDIPQYLQNTMTEYAIRKKDLIGAANEPEQDYDLMTVIMIRRGKDAEEEGIFDYLKGLFKCNLKKIEDYSHIQWSEPFRKEARTMTGFGDAIYREGYLEGKQQGKQEGVILGALLCGSTPEQVAKMLQIPLSMIKEVAARELSVK